MQEWSLIHNQSMLKSIYNRNRKDTWGSQSRSVMIFPQFFGSKALKVGKKIWKIFSQIFGSKALKVGKKIWKSEVFSPCSKSKARAEVNCRTSRSIFRPYLGKLKWKFPSHSRTFMNEASMAMRKSSCTNTPQYLRSCCSPIGQNNTEDFSAQSGGSIGRAVWKWSDKSRFPGALSALLVNLRRLLARVISSRLS